MTRPFAAVVLAITVSMPCLWAGSGFAQDCERPDTPAQATECATLRLRAAEREMAQYMGELMKSDDAGFKEALAAAQDAWMKWREAEGKLAGLVVTDRALEPVARLTAQAQMTEDRVKDLRNMR